MECRRVGEGTAPAVSLLWLLLPLLPSHQVPPPSALMLLQDFYQKECWAHHPKPHQESIDARKKQVGAAGAATRGGSGRESRHSIHRGQGTDVPAGVDSGLQQPWPAPGRAAAAGHAPTEMTWAHCACLQDEALAAERAKLIPGM